MFRAAAVEPLPDAPLPDAVPLSLLALEADPPGGWQAFAESHGVAVVADDLGRLAVARGAARVLLASHRDMVAREQEAAAARHERLEREAEEQDRVRRAQIWRGVPASGFPDGVSAASVLVAAIRDSQPKRESVLQEALSNSGGLTFHSFAPVTDES